MRIHQKALTARNEEDVKVFIEKKQEYVNLGINKWESNKKIGANIQMAPIFFYQKFLWE